jgi:hypothetical protein
MGMMTARFEFSQNRRNQYFWQKMKSSAAGIWVEEVAKCAECHTPRDEHGNLKKEGWLQGAPIWITRVRPIQNWADRAPALAGFPSFTEEQGNVCSKRELGRRTRRFGHRYTSTT